MPTEVITNSNQITIKWLTDVLAKSGDLSKGSVVGFDMDTNQRRLSTNIRLKLKYAQGSRGNMPEKLFLKMVNIDLEDAFFGPSEVNYYTRDYVGVPDVPIPKAYEASYSDTLRRYHVLMDDLSETHIQSYERTPSLEHGFALADGLSAMHAHWWGRERLEAADEPIPHAEAINRLVNIAQPGVEHVIEVCAEQLEAHWPDAMRELFDRHPQEMVERTKHGNGFTLIHGDTNLLNILIPIKGHRPVYIIDRQPFDWSLTTWLGVYDLSYLMVMRWGIEVRRELEKPILKRYHDQLIMRNVHEYSWDQLYDDYRLSAAMSIYILMEWYRGGLNEEPHPFWLFMLRNSMTAFDDLECGELW